jgi:oxygen-dependent protoporphyrinogen oxidase
VADFVVGLFEKRIKINLMIAIIGAGISGLSLGYYLAKKNANYTIFEAANEVGGYIKSEKIGNYCLDYGANTLLADAEIEQLLDELQLSSSILEAAPTNKNRFIFKNGQYQKLPSSPPALLISGFFSLSAKWRILTEFFQKKQNNLLSTEKIKEETVAHFFERHFGKEILDYAVAPFVSGIYAGDAQQLLIAKTFPTLVEMEQQYGSILKALIKNKNTTSRKKTLSFTAGMEMLPKALAKNLHINFGTTITKIEKNETGKWWIYTENNRFEAEKVVLALPAFAAAKVLENVFPAVSNTLAQVTYAPMAVVHTAFKKQDTGILPDGFGGLHPHVENLFSLGSIWNSAIFEGKCPKDEIIFTSFVGGTKAPQNYSCPDETLKENITKELQRNFKITQPPVFQHLLRWQKAIVQYDKNILPLDEIQKTLATENIFICANWISGVSLPDCLKKGKQMSEVLW